jgi:hypothetical protein
LRLAASGAPVAVKRRASEPANKEKTFPAVKLVFGVLVFDREYCQEQEIVFLLMLPRVVAIANRDIGAEKVGSNCVIL